ncbi:pyridoxamine 5'-phosphate oxidase family protein [Clostridium sp. E02]|uniref:pyridoxamine 5'-phosphate oxidase family protein n=1 Tax=Clostridium sp. E02 TaxID=2487134 RepID=UPI000F51F103|nr:pyridoxamine 5'-phosphate oxidase family protein [Clostridium sp. E02]
MKNTLVLYETKYGFTEMVSKDAAMVLGPATCMKMTNLPRFDQYFNFVLLCFPIYTEQPDPSVIQWVNNHREWLKQSKVALLCTCLETKLFKTYLNSVSHILGDCVVYQNGIASKDCYKKEEAINTLFQIKRIKDQPDQNLERKKLLPLCEDFLMNHNTCVLSTGIGMRVRSTPVEYRYQNGFIYIYSEGGEKFANLLLNSSSSIGIFNEFQGMNQLRGMQITGNAKIMEYGSAAYRSSLKLRDLDFDKVEKMPFPLHIIQIKIIQIEFLWSGFSQMGVDIKQILRFDSLPV